jgi:hypothetical protein
MKVPRLFTIAVLAAVLPALAKATTLTITGQLHAFSYWDAGNYMNWFTGYADVGAGDPYSLKLTFNDAAFVTPAPGLSAFSAAALTDFEFSIDGIVRMTSTTDMKVQALNNVGGRDTLIVNANLLATTVTGLDPYWWGGPRGFFSLQFQDPTQTALELGVPWDFTPFFADTGAISIGLGFETGGPYSGEGPQMFAAIRDGDLPAALPPPSSQVPDSGSTLGITLLGLAALSAVRRFVIA